MDFREKLRSFPVIAAAIVLLAILIGIFLGLSGAKPRALPVKESAGESEARSGGVRGGKPDNNVPAGPSRDDSTRAYRGGNSGSSSSDSGGSKHREARSAGGSHNPVR